MTSDASPEQDPVEPAFGRMVWRIVWVLLLIGALVGAAVTAVLLVVVSDPGLAPAITLTVMLLCVGMAVPPALFAGLGIALVQRPPRSRRAESWAAGIGSGVGALIAPVVFWTVSPYAALAATAVVWAIALAVALLTVRASWRVASG